jgi:hypothetical protein
MNKMAGISFDITISPSGLLTFQKERGLAASIAPANQKIV